MRSTGVVACAVLAMVLAGCGGGSAGRSTLASGSGTMPTTSGTAPVTAPTTAPVTTPPATATPTQRPPGGLTVTIPCRSVQLSAGVTVAANGTAQVQLTNTGRSTCSISGWVSVQGLDRVGGVVESTIGVLKVASPGPPVRLDVPPGSSVWAGLGLTVGHGCAGLQVTPPVDTRALPARLEGAAMSGCPARIGTLRAARAEAHL